MNKIYQVYKVSDSTGETLDRIFLAIKAQFSNFKCKTIHFSFTRTENQIDKIISDLDNSDVILVGISRTSKTPTSIYLANRGYKVANIPIIPNKSMPTQLIEYLYIF